MNCQEVMELMQRSLDGDLDSHETSRMMEHIRTCPECAAMYERLTRLSNNLAQLPRVVPRFSIVDSILPRLEELPIGPAADDAAREEAESGVPAATPSRSSRPNRKTYRRLAGAIAAGVVAGLIIISNPFSWMSGSSNDNDAASMSEAGLLSKAGEPASAPAEEKMSANSSSGAAGGDESAMNDQAAPSSNRAIEPETPAANTESADDKQLDVRFMESLRTDETVSGDKAKTESADAGRQAAANSQPPSDAPQMTLQIAPSPPASADGGSEADMSVSGAQAVSKSGTTFPAAIAPAFVWASPDGKYKATVEEERMKVYETSENKLVFQSDVRSGHKIGSVRWDEDSANLHYSWTDADGKTVSYRWEAATGRENAEAVAEAVTRSGVADDSGNAEGTAGAGAGAGSATDGGAGSGSGGGTQSGATGQ
ncbi:hypothetical protein J19TS2_43970 [Cohnella xylanilytica]|uniref:zf-HC2 domain-containing protein n=1 Tax=Cohnella xylanilytica TaxID=557555 RepID=UPI001B055C78|nr:zf-HC2 domain-containing protein [Cohnella xylanilytica]GIO14842.1 hypothetical protein J19TS2_43970 [Cohnella xylanilytica]